MTNFIYYDYATSQICKVKENQKSYIKASNVPTYLNTLCLAYGSTLDGRKEAYKHSMHQKKFIPIRIYEDVIYFPSKAIDDPSCIWINYSAIESIEYSKKICTIHFRDHTYLNLTHPKRIQHILQSIRQYLQLFQHP